MSLPTDPLLTAEHDAPSPRLRGSSRRILVVIASVAVAAAIVVTLTWPQAFGLHRMFGVAQLIAFRPVMAIGFGAGALLATAIALMTRRRTLRILAVIGAAVFLTASLVHVAVLGVRGWGSALTSSADDASQAQGDLIVLSWNAQGGATSPQEIAELALSVRPDVIALPETDVTAAGEVRTILADHGLIMAASTVGDSIPTSVLISVDLGRYLLDASRGSTPGLPSGVWLPEDADSPAIVVAHPLPPLPSSMNEWRDGLDWVAEQCRTLGTDVIVAGDLNATVDHFGTLPECSDAAAMASTAASGTWPSTVPQALASPIDHVLVGSGWKTLDFRVFDSRATGSDHRPIVAVLGS